MPPKLLKANLSKIVDLTPTVRELHLQLTDPETFQFKAGQFVMLHISNQEGKIVQRAYSVASADTETRSYKLVIKFYEFGVASTWVKSLKGGEEISYTGPFGKFLFRDPAAEQVIHVATSTGVAPLYSMMASRGPSGPLKNTDVHVFMGVWNEKEIFYQKELEELRKWIPKLQVHFVLDSPLVKESWRGKTGFVTPHIAELDLARPTEFYICGNPAMIKSVKEMLTGKNFPTAKIYTESYG